MQLEHTFTVPRPASEAFAVLRDIERIAPCMPGASIDSVDGEEFSGKVKVKVGPMQVTYSGTARFVEVDEDNFRGVIEASGKEMRGSGTAKATFTATLVERGDETEVKVVSDLAITGRPAQFGRGVMADVGEKLIGQFADCLSSELARDEEPAATAPTGGEAAGGQAAAPGSAELAEATATAAAGTAQAGLAEAAAGSGTARATERPRPTDEVLDLLDVAGGSVARRVAPVAAAALLLALIVWLVRRRR
jgi:uncharacterized protein